MKDKKVIILDFDGTFYSGNRVFSKVNKHVDKYRRLFLSKLTDLEYKRICKENSYWLSIYRGGDIVECLYDFKKRYPEYNINPRDFYNWQSAYPDPIVLKGAQLVSAKFIKKLCNQYPVYVVSDSSLTHLILHMSRMGIDYKWFSKVIANKFTSKDRSKKHYYKKIMEKEECEASNVYVFGDSIKSDLEPGIMLGMKTYHIINAYDLEPLINELFK